MQRLPLYYCDQHVGFARTDDSLVVPQRFVWRLRVPRSIRRQANGCKEIIAALLYNDPMLRSKCTPQTWLARARRFDLVSLVLRPQLIKLLDLPIYDERIVDEINQKVSSIGIIGYKDGDKTNLCSSNIREFTNAVGLVSEDEVSSQSDPKP